MSYNDMRHTKFSGQGVIITTVRASSNCDIKIVTQPGFHLIM